MNPSSGNTYAQRTRADARMGETAWQPGYTQLVPEPGLIGKILPLRAERDSRNARVRNWEFCQAFHGCMVIQALGRSDNQRVLAAN